MKSLPHLALLLLTIVFNLPGNRISAQCSVSNVRPPASVTELNLAGSDFDWDDTNDALTLNNDYAYAGATLTLLNPSKYSNYLSLSNFNISIPSAVTICGIVVQVDRKATGLSLAAVVKDYRVRLIKGGSITGDNKASSTAWTGSATTATYGGSSDLWGSTWTPADINNGNFGFAISAEISGLLGVFLSADIDNVRITVYYQHIVLPVSIEGFVATQKGKIVELFWNTTNVQKVRKFIVERQLSSSTWQPIQEITMSEHEPKKRTCRAYDFQPKDNNSYRLKMLDDQYTISYSQITNLKLDNSPNGLLIEIHHSDKTILLIAQDPIMNWKIFRADGTLIAVTQNTLRQKQLSIPLRSLPKGHLVIQAETNRKRMSKHLLLQ